VTSAPLGRSNGGPRRRRKPGNSGYLILAMFATGTFVASAVHLASVVTL